MAGCVRVIEADGFFLKIHCKFGSSKFAVLFFNEGPG
jgi:hypothetical protein